MRIAGLSISKIAFAFLAPVFIAVAQSGDRDIEGCSRPNLPDDESGATSGNGGSGKEQPPHCRPASLGEALAAIDADGKAEIDIFLGYYDYSPERSVGNAAIREVIVKFLQEPCRVTGLGGFERESEGANRFRRTQLSDRGEPRTVHVALHDPAVDTRYHGVISAEQRNRSFMVQRDFEDRVGNGEVVFYLGHSRYGGGPDFYPPKLRVDRTLNAAYYSTYTPGMRNLLEALDGSALKVFGVFSCDSIGHFAAGIEETSPNVLFLGTTVTPSFTSNVKSLLRTLAAIIDPECNFDRDYDLARLSEQFAK